jgi:hypothetical protein
MPSAHRSNPHTMFNMFIRNRRLATLAGCRPMSTAGGRLGPTSVLSLHRSFPYTLYKVNPGKRSNIVDPATSARSEHFHDRDEVENLIEGRVYPTITSSGLSPVPVAFVVGVLTTISTPRATVFSSHTLAPGAS